MLDQVNEPLETEKSMEEVVVSRSKVTQMADVTVETFPLPSITQPAYNLDGNSDEVEGLKGTLVEKMSEWCPWDQYMTLLSQME